MNNSRPRSPQERKTPAQVALLESILASDCLTADELPAVHELMHSPKNAKTSSDGLFDFEEKN